MSEGDSSGGDSLAFFVTLYPRPDELYTGSDGERVQRFGFFVGTGLREIGSSVQPFPAIRAVLCPELPHSVLPLDLVLAYDIAYRVEPDSAAWPTFRGVRCRRAFLTAWLRNEALEGSPPTAFDIPVLVPESAIPAAAQRYLSDETSLLLGSDFCLRERLSVHLAYEILARDAEGRGGEEPPPTLRCGSLMRIEQDEP